MNEFLKFLKSDRDPIKTLRDEYAVIVKYNDEKTLVQLNYSQIDSPKGTLADWCRGLILDAKTLNPVAFSFKRFYNFGEIQAADIHWPSALAHEKHDGSLITVYNHNGQWNVSTRGTIYGTGPVIDLKSQQDTFADRVKGLIQRDTGGDLQELMKMASPNNCYILEYCGPYNRIVRPYEEECLVLLAVTHKEMMEDSLFYQEINYFKRCKSFNVKDLDQVINMSNNEIDELDEGFVVQDVYNNRIKIKAENYVRVHRLVNAGGPLTDKRLADIALAGEVDEVCTYFPEFKERLMACCDEINLICLNAESWYNDNEDMPIGAEFGKKASHQKMSGWIFATKRAKTNLSCREWATENMKGDYFV